MQEGRLRQKYMKLFANKLIMSIDLILTATLSDVMYMVSWT